MWSLMIVGTISRIRRLLISRFVWTDTAALFSASAIFGAIVNTLSTSACTEKVGLLSMKNEESNGKEGEEKILKSALCIKFLLKY